MRPLRAFLRSSAPILTLYLVVVAGPAALPGQEIVLAPVASGLTNPVDITHAGDGSGRLFIVEQAGRIRILKNGVLLGTPFLDIDSLVSSGGERGLLGLAFHPQYASNGLFFVNYTDNDGDTVIARYSVSANPDVANSVGTILLEVDQPESNHNGGDLAFSPVDGYLYIALGDGGGGNDPGEHGQDPTTLLGSILRIDVDVVRGPGVNYEIPPDNPFVGSAAGADEVWAFGLRNPWRISFDRQTGDLFIGDVGQGAWEEIDYQPASSDGGENYGWDCREGMHTNNTDPSPDCASPVNPPLVEPILEYSHSGGDCSVTGGYLVRRPGELSGRYIFADYCTGLIRLGTRNGNSWSAETIHDAPFRISTFGEDEAGSIYLASHNTGIVYRVDELIFEDGFESGNTSAWSGTVN